MLLHMLCVMLCVMLSILLTSGPRSWPRDCWTPDSPPSASVRKRFPYDPHGILKCHECHAAGHLKDEVAYADAVRHILLLVPRGDKPALAEL